MVNQVFLVGYMGAGKTSAAKALSVHSGLSMLDLDEALERQEGRTIIQLFEQEGEAAFRNKESALLRKVANRRLRWGHHSGFTERSNNEAPRPRRVD